MEKIVEIDGLFKVYFLWEKFFYIELLRPLDRTDFDYITDTPQSVRFLKDSEWFYRLKLKTKSDGTIYSPVYKANQIIKLKHQDLLTSTLQDNLTNGSNSKGEIKDALGSLFSYHKCGLHISFNYSGCPDNDSRSRKNSRILSELETMVSSKGENKISSMFSKAIEKITKQIEYYNLNYINEMKSAVTENSNFHNDIKSEYSSRVVTVVDTIVSKRSEISRLENEIKSVENIVETEHKRLVNDSINGWTDLPQFVRDECKSVTNELKVYGVSSRGLFNDRNSIFISKPETEEE